MSDSILNKKALEELHKLLNSAEFSGVRQAQHAQNLRGEVTAGWLDSFMNRMYASEVKIADHLVDATTGKAHTVESMVAELRDRVKLDILTKSGGDIPLSKKMAEQIVNPTMEELETSIRNFLTSHRGYADDQAILYHLRETFGEDGVNKLSDKLTEKIKLLKTELAEPLVGDHMAEDSSLGQPLKLEDKDPQNDRMFNSIQEALSGSK